MEKALQMRKDLPYRKMAAHREEQQRASSPLEDGDTPYTEDAAMSNHDSDTGAGTLIVPSAAFVETRTGNQASVPASNINVEMEVSALVDELLHSAEQGASSDDDDGRSNYSDDVNARHRKKDKLRSRGRSVSDTDKDDLEAENEMLCDVVDENRSPVRSSHVPRRKGPTAKEKGKGHAVELQSGASGEEDSGHGKSSKRRCTPGPLSEEARREAQQLGEATQETATALAKKYNKPYGSIMVAAGLGVQNTRGQNFSNQYKAWYSAKFPKDDKCEYSCVSCLFATNHGLASNFRRVQG
jgi:hypothetical protein